MIMSKIAIIIILSYLLGSVPFSIIMCRLWRGIDIRDYGSRNAGFTNVYRVVGGLPAAVVLILDAAKGAAAVLLAAGISSVSVPMNPINLKLLAAILVVAGHVFPIFAGFRGGKGIATALGALISIIPIEVVSALILFVAIVAITRYVSLGSLSAAVFVFFALVLEKCCLKPKLPLTLLGMVFLLTAFIFFNHRNNIKRLLAGKENRFGRKGKGSDLKNTGQPEVKK
jgi:glycerol-3-phosphate acyltransferase PlsY